MDNSSKKTIKLTTLRPLKSHLLKNNKGFSLVSILVASGIGVFLMSNVLDSQVTSTKIYSKITTANKYEWSETLMKEIISRGGYVDPDGAGPLTNIKKCLETLNEKIKLDDDHEFRVKYHDENDALINPQPTDPDNPSDTAEYFDPDTPPDTAKYYYIAEYDGENFKDRPSVKIVDNKCEVVGSGDVECYNVDDTGKTRVGCEDESATDEILAEILKQPVTFGFNAGKKDGVGDYSTFVGNAAGQNTTGKGNSFFGYEAGRENTTGYQNSFFGNKAGMENTEGHWNTFVGYDAGRENKTGYRNSFFGSLAGFKNTEGNRNSFFGSRAGRENTTGYENSFFGNLTGWKNTTGYQNSFFGNKAGMENTEGHWNTFVGYDAGRENKTGSSNTFVGHNAGRRSDSGSGNSFFGYGTGVHNKTGSSNTFVGYDSGQHNVNGNYNNFFGYGTGKLNKSGNYNNFFGYEAGFDNQTGSRNIYIGYKSGCSDLFAGNLIKSRLLPRPCSSASNNIYIGAVKPKDNKDDDLLNIAGVIRATNIEEADKLDTKIILKIGGKYCELEIGADVVVGDKSKKTLNCVNVTEVKPDF